jgi:outer membrane protein assembly factor BamB
VNGVLYDASSDGNLYAFDAAGSTNCSGTPKVCAPLWTASTGRGQASSSPAVANGVLYVSGNRPGQDLLFAFDAAGATGCSGTPKVCTPLWTAPLAGSIGLAPAVANGMVYVGESEPNFLGQVAAFDAAGSKNCSGTPKTCSPLWTSPTLTAITSSPAVANGVLYIGSSGGKLYAFDAAGVTNCSGTPTTCAPLWSTASYSMIPSSPAVANGVVYVGAWNGNFYAFDAAGAIGCSGTPKTCMPLWTSATRGPIGTSPAIDNGVLYIGSDDGNLYAYSLGAPPALH